jgi:hypothetical protein
MTDKSPLIEVTVMREAAVVRFMRTECLMRHFDPRQDVRKDLFTLVDTDHHTLIVLDFGNPDIKWLSGAFQAILVRLHCRLLEANGSLKLCDLPEAPAWRCKRDDSRPGVWESSPVDLQVRQSLLKFLHSGVGDLSGKEIEEREFD